MVVREEALSQATTGLWAGIAGLILAAVGPFSCYSSYLPALGLAIFAAITSHRAEEALRAIPEAEAERRMAMAGLVTGVGVGVMSGAFVALMAGLMLLYGGLFLIAMIGSLLSGGS
jgi:hypothetical protein